MSNINLKISFRRILQTALKLLTLLLLCQPVYAGEASRLRAECINCVASFDYVQLATKGQALVEVAKKEGDQLSLGYAYYCLGVMHLNTGKGALCKQEYDKALDISRRVKSDSLAAITMTGLGIYEASVNANLYVAQYYFQQALQACQRCNFQKQRDGLYINLAQLASEQNDTTGLKYALTAYNESVKQNNNYGMRLAATVIAKLYNIMNKQDLALEWTNRAIDVNSTNGYASVSDLYALKSNILMDQGHLKEAQIYAEKAISSLKNADVLDWPATYLQMANVLNKMGDYAKSNSYLTQGLSYAEQAKTLDYRISIYRLFSENYEKLGDHENAVSYLTKAQDLESKTTAANREHMANERQLIIEVAEKDKSVALSEAKARQQLIISIGLGIGVLLAIAICIIIWYNNRRRHRLYQNIVRRNKEAIERERELKERLAEANETISNATSSNDDVQKAVTINEDKVDMIYDSLVHLMEDEKIYKDNQLTRDTLADKLGTNRTYLTRVVSERSGMNIPTFINHYRIEEAVRILSDKDNMDYPLKQLYSDLGFSSLSTFYKLFQTHVGMSPSAYRKSVQEVED